MFKTIKQKLFKNPTKELLQDYLFWVYFYRYKNKPLYFYASSFAYVVALALYILTSSHRMGRITAWIESLLS